jgi:hypothetical protein
VSEDCPVIVYAAPDVDRSQLLGQKCRNCGHDLSEHEFQTSEYVTPGMAYAMNDRLVDA